MRKFLKLFFLATMIFSIKINAQNIQIVSNTTDWLASTNQNGPYNLPVFDVGLCVNEQAIDCICGINYASPALSANFAGCNGFQPIWGTAPPANCVYPAQEFWFERRFNLDLDKCSIVNSALARVQGDNEYTFVLNGTEIDATDSTMWQIDNVYDVSGNLVNGENVIRIRVRNINGGTCFNYAFLAFCMNIQISQVTIDASFLPFTSPGNPITIYPGNYELYDNLGAQHSWYLLSSKTSCPQSINDFTPIVAYAGESFNYTTAQTGVYYWVLHRVRTICGEACYLESICTGCPENKVKTDCHWNGPIDCSFVDNWEWIWDSVKGSGGEARSNNSTLEHHKVLISPNPAQELLNISWDPRTPMKNLQLFSVEGKLVKSNTLQEGVALHTLKVSDLAPGTYFLRLTDKDGNVENHKVEITQ